METILIAYLSLTLIAAALIDIKYRKIPNYLTIPTMLTALVYYGYTKQFPGLLFSLKGMTLGIALFFIPWLKGWVGAGDAKLMGAVGAVVGVKGVFLVMLFTSLVGGIFVLIFFLFNLTHAKDFLTNTKESFKTLLLIRQFNATQDENSKKKFKIGYGAAIACGTFIYIVTELTGFQLIPFL